MKTAREIAQDVKDCYVDGRYGDRKNAMREGVDILASHLDSHYQLISKDRPKPERKKIERIQCNYCVKGQEQGCSYHRDVIAANKLNEIIDFLNQETT